MAVCLHYRNNHHVCHQCAIRRLKRRLRSMGTAQLLWLLKRCRTRKTIGRGKEERGIASISCGPSEPVANLLTQVVVFFDINGISLSPTTTILTFLVRVYQSKTLTLKGKRITSSNLLLKHSCIT